MKIRKRVAYKVQCASCNKLFDKVFEIEEGSENSQSEVEAYCPFCDNQVRVSVEGKIVANAELLRKIKLSPKTAGKE